MSAIIKHIGSPLGSRGGIRSISGFGSGSAPTGTAFDPSAGTKSTHITLSNNNLTAAAGAGSGSGTNVLGTSSALAGGSAKYYSEVTIGGSGGAGIGLVDSTWTVDGTFAGGDDHGVVCYNDGNVYDNGATTATIASFTTGNIIRFAADFANRKLWWALGAAAWNSVLGSGDPATNTLGIPFGGLMSGNQCKFVVEMETSGNAVTVNFNATGSAFAFSIPSGFTGWP